MRSYLIQRVQIFKMAQYSVTGGDIACVVGLASQMQCVLEPSNSKFLF